VGSTELVVFADESFLDRVHGCNVRGVRPSSSHWPRPLYAAVRRLGRPPLVATAPECLEGWGRGFTGLRPSDVPRKRLVDLLPVPA
jgi:hypothetical protein